MHHVTFAHHSTDFFKRKYQKRHRIAGSVFQKISLEMNVRFTRFKFCTAPSQNAGQAAYRLPEKPAKGVPGHLEFFTARRRTRRCFLRTFNLAIFLCSCQKLQN